MSTTRSPMQEGNEDNQIPKAPKVRSLHRRGSQFDSPTMGNASSGEDSDEEVNEKTIGSTTNPFGAIRVYEQSSPDTKAQNVKHVFKSDGSSINAAFSSLSTSKETQCYPSDLEAPETVEDLVKPLIEDNKFKKLNVGYMLTNKNDLESSYIAKQYQDEIEIGDKSMSDDEYHELIKSDLTKYWNKFYDNKMGFLLAHFLFAMWNILVCSTLLGLAPTNASPAIVPLVVYFLMMVLGFYFYSKLGKAAHKDEDSSKAEHSSKSSVRSWRYYDSIDMNKASILYILAHKDSLMDKCSKKLRDLCNWQKYIIYVRFNI